METPKSDTIFADDVSAELAIVIAECLQKAGCDQNAEIALLTLARSVALVLGRMNFVDRVRLKPAFIRQVDSSTQEVVNHLARGKSSIIMPDKPPLLN